MTDHLDEPRRVGLPPLTPVQPGASLGDAIYLSLRGAILQGSLPPGYRLREVPLSEHFGVSSTPVRSAVQRLGLEGLVEVTPRRGAVVAPVTVRQLRYLYEVRELLECHAIRSAAERDDLDLGGLEDLLRRTEAVLDDPDQSRFHDLDLAFHGLLTQMAGNTELAQLAERTHRRIQAVRVRYVPRLPGRPRTSHRDHLAIVSALRQGDADRAEERLRQHITDVRDAVLELATAGDR
jgi:DNA-binding GntR family transcriptional regulator